MVEELIKELRLAEGEAVKIEEEGKQTVKEIFLVVEKEINLLREQDHQEIESQTFLIEQSIKEELNLYSSELKAREKQLFSELREQKTLKQRNITNYLSSLIFKQVENGNS
ncbi:MAG: hypothetical protein DDT42_00566 [candidate division WS2 bacterium]|uniref:Uncharacterized protein n=1 Tax=Psychracetigena formicireducens TaxID=2986056 RepID=A0A9E2F6L5_PSYF1|nr:hypothetical protein [Candidatus Psychracetigena formicireducens]MBT9144718.1 hypothetical protein [Candidatus Psychracetigena formicireducens]